MRHLPTTALLALAAVSAACAAPAGMAPAPGSTSPAVAAAGAAGSDARAAASVLTGLARLGLPIAGATVTLRDAQGQAIGQPARTTAMGGFAFAAADLPADFVVEVAGGTIGGRALGGTLRAVVRGLSAADNHVDVTATSTLAAARLAAHPAEAPAAATRLAASYLGLSVGPTGRPHERTLDLEALAVSGGAGGLGAALDRLATAFASGAAAPGSFASAPHQSAVRRPADWVGSLAIGARTDAQVHADALGLLDTLDTNDGIFDLLIGRRRGDLLRAGFHDPQIDGVRSAFSDVRHDVHDALEKLTAASALGQPSSFSPFDPVALAWNQYANAVANLATSAPGQWDAALVGDQSANAQFSRGLVGADSVYGGAADMGLWWNLADAYGATTTYLLRDLARRQSRDEAAVLRTWSQARQGHLAALRGASMDGDTLDLGALGAGQTLFSKVPGSLPSQMVAIPQTGSYTGGTAVNLTYVTGDPGEFLSTIRAAYSVTTDTGSYPAAVMTGDRRFAKSSGGTPWGAANDVVASHKEPGWYLPSIGELQALKGAMPVAGRLNLTGFRDPGALQQGFVLASGTIVRNGYEDHGWTCDTIAAIPGKLFCQQGGMSLPMDVPLINDSSPQVLGDDGTVTTLRNMQRIGDPRQVIVVLFRKLDRTYWY